MNMREDVPVVPRDKDIRNISLLEAVSQGEHVVAANTDVEHRAGRTGTGQGQPAPRRVETGSEGAKSFVEERGAVMASPYVRGVCGRQVKVQHICRGSTRSREYTERGRMLFDEHALGLQSALLPATLVFALAAEPSR